MQKKKSAIEYVQGQQLLYVSTLRGVPFTLSLAIITALYLDYLIGTSFQIYIWLCLMLVINFVRLLQCRIVLKKQLFSNLSSRFQLNLFFILAGLTGVTWVSIYFWLMAYTNLENLQILLLVYGGICAACSMNLSVYYSALMAYILSIIVPVILYHLSLGTINHILQSVMFTIFLGALILIGKTNQNQLKNIFVLTEKIGELSITDELTGLFNRRHFAKTIKDVVKKNKSKQHSFALLSIDLDNFKLINDNFGHTFGDNFIVYTAKYLSGYLRKKDILFRIGGDEFVAIVENITEHGALERCQIIQKNFTKKPVFKYKPHDRKHEKVLSKVSLSIGAVFVPFDTQSDIKQIIEKADQSLYRSKHAGKNQIKFIRL